MISDSTVNGVAAEGSSSSMISNSTISSITVGFVSDSNVSLVSLPTGFVSQWNIHRNNIVSNAYIDLTIYNTWIGHWGIVIHDYSTLSLTGMAIEDVWAQEFSTVLIINSTVKHVWAIWNSTIYMSDSKISSLGVDTDGYTTVFLINSTYLTLSWIEWGLGNPKIYVAWYLDLFVIDSRGLSIPNAPIEVYWENETLLSETTTGKYGWTRLILYEKRIEYSYAVATFHYANYTVKATYGDYTKETLVESISTNTKINITVPTIPGDVSSDGIVDIQDLILITVVYGSTSVDWYWNPYADQNGDNVINFHDFMVVLTNMKQEDQEKIKFLAWQKTRGPFIPE